MNIIFFIGGVNNRGGVERALISLINSLSEHSNVNIYLLTFNDVDTDKCFPINNKVNRITLNISNYKTQLFKLYRNFNQVIREYRIDTVVSVETISLLFSYFPVKYHKLKPKMIVWEHFNFLNNNGRKSRDWFRKLAARKADSIITLTERDKEMWIEKLKPKAKIDFIYNITPFEDIKNTYSIQSKKAIAVGRYVSVKGFERLIQIWNRFEEKYNIKDWELHIVGYGEEKQKLEKQIESSPSKNIYLIDGIGGVEQHFSEASFNCLTSYYEGLPMTLIEAQSFNLPSIAFDIYTGPSEILSNNSGILVPDNDIEKFADAIHQLVSDDKLRQSISNNASKNKSKFHSHSIALEWLKLFKAIE